MRQGRFGARRHRPNLLGAAARTVVIAGTASAVTGAIRRRHDNHAEQQATAPPPEPGSDRLERLERLADLRKTGVLSEAEFEVEKADILRRQTDPAPR